MMMMMITMTKARIVKAINVMIAISGMIIIIISGMRRRRRRRRRRIIIRSTSKF